MAPFLPLAPGSITDVSTTLPSAALVWDTLTLQAGFNSTSVILGTTFLGTAAGIVGCFSLLRKRALVGDALAHCTLPGLAVAYLCSHFAGLEGKNLVALLSGATIFGLLGVLAIQLITHHTRIKEDAAIGSVLSCFFGLGILLLSVIQSVGSGSAGGLAHFIYGQTAALSRSDSFVTLILALGATLCAILFIKEFRLVCFDREFAATQGWPVQGIDILLMTLVVLVTVIGLQSVGLLLIVALLIIPAASARFWTERLNVMTVLAGAIGGLSGYFGAITSSLIPRMPAGAIIVLVAGALFIFSFLFAPRRGVLAGGWRMLSLRIQVAIDHLLRELYEALEREGEVNEKAVPVLNLRSYRQWSIPFRVLLKSLLQFRRILLVSPDSKTLSLTPNGIVKATQLIRNHRLWEQYLLTYGRVASSHVDYSADLVEHILSGEVVRELEAALKAKGRLPAGSSTPLSSVHPIEVEGAR